MSGYLLDTCVWIYVETGVLAPEDVAAVTGNAPVYISPVTIAELTLGVELAATSEIRVLRSLGVERLKSRPVLTITIATGAVFGQIAAELRKKGHQHRQRVNDVWLAAQAIENNATLLTRNVQDFAAIEGLKLHAI